MYRINQELFPPPLKHGDFEPLFNTHGIEVRGRPFELDYKRYYQIEFEGRLVWVVARDLATEQPVGYSCHFWYRDLHFDERVAVDDLWFVLPEFRCKGIGLRLKNTGHELLEKQSVIRVTDTIRDSYNHPGLMDGVGFRPWGTRWMKEL